MPFFPLLLSFCGGKERSENDLYPLLETFAEKTGGVPFRISSLPYSLTVTSPFPATLFVPFGAFPEAEKVGGVLFPLLTLPSFLLEVTEGVPVGPALGVTFYSLRRYPQTVSVEYPLTVTLPFSSVPEGVLTRNLLHLYRYEGGKIEVSYDPLPLPTFRTGRFSGGGWFFSAVTVPHFPPMEKCLRRAVGAECGTFSFQVFSLPVQPLCDEKIPYFSPVPATFRFEGSPPRLTLTVFFSSSTSLYVDSVSVPSLFPPPFTPFTLSIPRATVQFVLPCGSGKYEFFGFPTTVTIDFLGWGEIDWRLEKRREGKVWFTLTIEEGDDLLGNRFLVKLSKWVLPSGIWEEP